MHGTSWSDSQPFKQYWVIVIQDLTSLLIGNILSSFILSPVKRLELFKYRKEKKNSLFNIVYAYKHVLVVFMPEKKSAFSGEQEEFLKKDN